MDDGVINPKDLLSQEKIQSDGQAEHAVRFKEAHINERVVQENDNGECTCCCNSCTCCSTIYCVVDILTCCGKSGDPNIVTACCFYNKNDDSCDWICPWVCVFLPPKLLSFPLESIPEPRLCAPLMGWIDLGCVADCCFSCCDELSWGD